MKSKIFMRWFVILFCCFIMSTFLHEVGHGVSSYAIGGGISTGFNRVGNAYKKPHDTDFRTGFDSFQNPYDMGPAVSLALAIGFTAAFVKLKSKNEIVKMIIGASALCNSLMRLIPMIHSYSGLITKGSFFVEDEIDTGMLWYKLTGIGVMKYMPSIISVAVSLICMCYLTRAFKRKLPSLFSRSFSFSAVVTAAYILSFIAENMLDNVIRINWA